MASSNLDKLKRLLAELFQLDQADLDFGIYRIMNQKRDDIVRFLDDDLLPQVKQAFSAYQSTDRTAIQTELDEAIAQAGTLGVDPDTVPKVVELRAKLEESGVDIAALESEVFSHLYSFFSRYYHEGDFLSLRRYKEGVYAIPYEGEEVKLHWANADQYYIKSSEYLRDYTFKLPSGKRVHFKLVEASTEQDNNKAANGKERRFIYAGLAAVAADAAEKIEATEITEGTEELVIRFAYQPDEQKRKQKQLNEQSVDAILSDLLNPNPSVFSVPSVANSFSSALSAPAPTEANPDRTLLAKHLNDYTARNTFDYFIHKDLGGFLRRELDFYIKNEVMHLDDIENETATRVEQYLSKIKALRSIAQKIIAFLEQFENFQKKLWLKKKFVIETNYCVTLDRVPEALYEQIAANDAQREEWVKLFAIDEIGKATEDTETTEKKKSDPKLFSESSVISVARYSELLTPEFLKANPFLVLDTRFFDEAFKDKLLSSIETVDEQTGGLLVRGDNFHGLRMLESRCRRRIECIYIDPPYNTGDSEILYKNEYMSASWLTLMENRIALAVGTLSEDPVLFIAIDDFEMVDLCELLDNHFALFRREMIVVNHHPQGGKAKTLANTHEYMLVCVARTSDRTLTGRLSDNGIEHRPFKRTGTAESNFRYGRPNSFYAILIDQGNREVVGLEQPPEIGSEYPTGETPDGFARVYPLGRNGEERVWRRSYESAQSLVSRGKLQCSEQMTIYQLVAAEDRTPALFSNWIDPRYNAGTRGANLLGDIIGSHNPFSYPKSIHTVEDAIFSAGVEDGATCLDFFAGSGTTGHAVINLNREDGGERKYILVEMGEHFDTVLKPRIQKVVYSRDWKDGKPVSREGSSHMFKYIRLESYEDALNNLSLKRTDGQQALLDDLPEVREEYMLSYMLDVESRGSASLLDVGAFDDPYAYKMNIARGDETKAVHVDLVETFNYLIGLTVKHIDHIRGVRVISGTSPSGERVLVLWRKVAETDNDALDKWFTKQGYNSKDMEYDLIYVNGDNNLENLRREDHTWKVRLIEEDFHRLMFDVEDV